MSQKNILKLGISLSFFYSFCANAANVSSWAELNDAAGDNIVFTGDIVASGTPTTINLNLTDPQTIDGGGYSLTGANNFQIKKAAGTSLTIQNFGSVIDADEGDYTYSYVDSENNTVYKKITGSISGFNKNPFIATNGLLTDLSITNSVFQNNTGELVKFTLNSADTEASITNSVFYGNTLATDDKAILSFGNGIVTLDNVIFASNNIQEFAMGIEVTGATVNINNSIIQNNQKGYFGAVQVDHGTLNINNSQFINNDTYCDGGAITVTKGLNTVSNSLFKGNKAGGWGNEGGGAIWYAQFSTSPVFTNDVFEDNQSGGPSGGGALFMSGTGVSTGALTILDSTFRNNRTTAANAVGGGMVAADLTGLFVVNSNFVGNSASFGGGIYAESNPFYIVDTDFTNNTALEGAAIYSGNAILGIYAKDKNVTFSGNTASNTTATYNGGAAVYFEDSNSADVEMNVNAASGRKVIFDNTIAAAGSDVVLNVNKSGLSYTMYDDTVVNIANSGEVQFNDLVGDAEGNIFNINLYGGTLSIGQNAALNEGFANPDGLLNNNNFYVMGAGTLNTANGVIGEFAPATFEINAALSYQLDIDLDNETIDRLTGATFGEGGSLTLSSLNIISDADVDGLRLTYSDTNIGGALKQGYVITTSSANYNVSVVNDELGSGLLISRGPDLGGLAVAIRDGSDVFSITSDEGENVVAWAENGNALVADLIINGNNHAITTENDLDGIDVGANYALTVNNVNNISGFNYAFHNSGALTLNETTVADAIINYETGTAEFNDSTINNSVNNSGTLALNNTEITGSLENAANASAELTDATIGGTIVNAGEITLNGTSVTGALNNGESGTVDLTSATINGAIVNNGVLEIRNGTTFGAVSGGGTTNINTDYTLSDTFAGNTLNVKNSELSGVDNLSNDVDLNVIGGTIALGNKNVSVKTANFDADSVLAITVNGLSDHGQLNAENITVANGAKLRATLAQNMISDSETISVQLLSANNTGFNNFEDVFDNNMFHFEKADDNGLYNISLVRDAGGVVEDAGATGWVAQAANSYVNGDAFATGSIGEDVANKLADLAQNDSEKLIENLKALAPSETAAVQSQAIQEVNRLFNNVDSYLRGEREPMGVSAGDVLDGLAIWVKPYSGKSKLHDRGGIAGFTTASHGAILGVEKKLTTAFKLGIGAQYDETDIDSLNRDIATNTKVGFVYGEYKPNKWFVNTIMSYGISDYDEDRFALGSRYEADYDIQTMSVAATTGYQFNIITPELGMRYYNIQQDEYTDTAMQRVEKINTNILRAAAGLHLTKDFGIFQPDVHFGLTYDIVTADHDTAVNLTNGTRYVVQGKELPRFGYEFDIGVNACLTDNIVVGATYMGAYREKYQEHTGMLRLKYGF